MKKHMETKIVRTGPGKILGVKIKNVWSWQGIPYAKPPVGELRFRRAQPPEPWENTYWATKQKANCPQANMKLKQDEDCLSLNIWVPDKGARKKPVLFYVHGGSFCSGSGNEAKYNGGKLAASRDVIVVTFNYRLGALGFLDFSYLNESFEANCGLSDVLAALRW
ncbi:MAG: carboxylesterase family protein, partial [Eubacteriales bacterium]